MLSAIIVQFQWFYLTYSLGVFLFAVNQFVKKSSRPTSLNMLSAIIVQFQWFYLSYSLGVFLFAVNQWAKKSSRPTSLRRMNVHSTLRHFFVFFGLLFVFLLHVHPDPKKMNVYPLIGCAVTIPGVVCAQILMWRKEAHLAETSCAALRATLARQT